MGNIGSGNGLLLNSTEPLPETMLTYPHWGLVALIHLMAILQKTFQDIYDLYQFGIIY